MIQSKTRLITGTLRSFNKIVSFFALVALVYSEYNLFCQSEFCFQPQNEITPIWPLHFGNEIDAETKLYFTTLEPRVNTSSKIRLKLLIFEGATYIRWIKRFIFFRRKIIPGWLNMKVIHCPVYGLIIHFHTKKTVNDLAKTFMTTVLWLAWLP